VFDRFGLCELFIGSLYQMFDNPDGTTVVMVAQAID